MNALSDNLKGMLLMTLSMALFTLADACVKLASEHISTGQITLALGVGGTILFWLMLARKGQPLFSSVFFEPAILLRTGGEMVATAFIVLALTYASFTGVTAIIQTLPIVLTLVSFLFLGEKVGIHRLTAVVAGFVGMLIIVRPGAAGFDAYSILAILAVVGMTMRDIGSRLAASHHSSVRLATFGTMAQIVMGAVWMLFEPAPSWPPLEAWAYIIGFIAFASLAIVIVTAAMRVGELSAVSPFRYTRLIFGISMGVLAFGDHLDIYMITGSGIILVAGLYIWQRERVQHAK